MPFIYEIALWLLTLVSMPWMLYQTAVHGKYRKSFFERLGKGFPTIDKGSRRVIWAHAVSVGETKAMSQLCKKLKSATDNPILIVTSITETGHEEALRAVPEADYHLYLPFDLYFIIAPIVKNTAPDLVILCEGDFWYNFLRCAKHSGAEIVLVNGKISEKSKNRFLMFPAFATALFSQIDLYCTQSDHYRERFEALGVPHNKIVVTGNLKFDDSPLKFNDEEKLSLKRQWGIPNDDPVLVIGSSHDPEERQILGVLKNVWNHFPNLKVILVPRHPERFGIVADLLTSLQIPFIRQSQLPEHVTNQHRVVLVDAMGLLRQCYQIATVAIVAGSYTDRVGGHNILEPLWFGVPTIFGPYMHTQPELLDLVTSYGAGLQVPIEGLEEKLLQLLQGGSESESLQRAGYKLVSDMSGSTERSLQAINRQRN
jgi:3-deoxy-D-manno-octulosonic-acid transferase